MMELYINIKFDNNHKLYTFKTIDDTLQKNDYVVVESARGIELGKVMTVPRKTHDLSDDFEIKEILRSASREDLEMFKKNRNDAKKALKICQTYANQLKLKMEIVVCEYTLDRSKLTFIYIADDRVDFRELLKILATEFRTRIELRQVGVRDRARYISGVGICGRELCCHGFINDFEMISINMAKNQLLALNVSKLSGQCGKLKCCLKYEDDVYTDIRKDLPKIGSSIEYEHNIYRLSSINIINRTCKLENHENALFIKIDEVLKKGKVINKNTTKKEATNNEKAG